MLNSIGNNNVSDKINRLVEALPERYQPIFGFEDFTSEAERESSDRLAIVMNIANLLVKHLQRPIRVLDLGCAQGFFSLNLAGISESIVGIDYLDKNVELCTGLAEFHHFEHVKFYENDIASFVSTLEPDSYDLVLGLNVFHHVCHAIGYDETKRIINKIAQNSKVLLTELALKEEPLYWAESLPDNVYSNLDNVAYQYTLQMFATHLSDVARPLIFSSNYLWCDGVNIGEFSSWKDEPHEYSHGYHLNSRRYFFSESNVIKCYYFNNGQKQNNLQEFQKEYSYFKSGHTFPSFIPAIVSCTQNTWQGVVVLEKVEGELLSSRIAAGGDFSHKDIISNLLTNVTELEKNGLYHTDLRIWNIFLAKDTQLNFIDIGSITTDIRTTSWPFNVFVDFIILVQDVIKAHSDEITAVRYPFLLDTWYDESQVKVWISLIWSTPHSDWNFKLFLDLWNKAEQLSESSNIDIHPVNIKYWMKLVETFLVFNPREEKFINSLFQKNFFDYYYQLSGQLEKTTNFIYSLDAKVKEFEADNSQNLSSIEDKINEMYKEYHDAVGYLDKRIDQLNEGNGFSVATIDDKLNNFDDKFSSFSDAYNISSENNRKELTEKIVMLEQQCNQLTKQIEIINTKRPSLLQRIIDKLLPK